MATNVLELRPSGLIGNAAPPAKGPATGVTIRAAADILAAAHRLAGKVGDHGLRIMIWHDLATLDQPVDDAGTPINAAAFGWSDEDLAPWHNIDKALRSPLLRAARVACEPLWINRDGIHTRAANRLLGQIDLLDLEGAACGAAIVIPLHMALGQIGVAILTPEDPAQDDLSAHFPHAAGPLAAAVWQFVTSYVSISRDERYLPSDSLLTSREIECLSWVAHGKTDYEISIIMGCSHAGIRYHVTRACAKLGAVNRAQSVFRAAQLGYLGVPLQPRHSHGGHPG